jgi:hypothetical protein
MMCTPRHLRVSGNKQELVQRLVQAGWTADCGVKPVPKRRRTAAAAAQPPVEEAEDEHGEEARTGCFGDQSGFTSDEEEDREIELESESSYSDDNGDVPVKIWHRRGGVGRRWHVELLQGGVRAGCGLSQDLE